MRKFWFGVSLVAVFMFAAASSYIFFVLTGGKPEVKEPEIKEQYTVAGDLGEHGSLVPCITAQTLLTVRESYACGLEEERQPVAGGEFLGVSFDQLAKEGWAVARIGENQVEIAKEYSEVCPIEQEKRLVCRTERGVVVYAGTAEHTGAKLLEMPLNFAELPEDINNAMLGEGYQLESVAELDELLESMDELVRSE